MSYYRTCPHCGSNLDPGEKCPCGEIHTVDIPVRQMGEVRTYTLTTEDKQLFVDAAKDGIISAADYIDTMILITKRANASPTKAER